MALMPLCSRSFFENLSRNLQDAEIHKITHKKNFMFFGLHPWKFPKTRFVSDI
jgi:hypothetical protein